MAEFGGVVCRCLRQHPTRAPATNANSTDHALSSKGLGSVLLAPLTKYGGPDTAPVPQNGLFPCLSETCSCQTWVSACPRPGRARRGPVRACQPRCRASKGTHQT
eukprot:808759-Rhodomonas_salina.3